MDLCKHVLNYSQTLIQILCHTQKLLQYGSMAWCAFSAKLKNLYHIFLSHL